MNPASSAHFDQQYQSHLKHLKLKGLQPKTVEAYSRAIRRIGDYFDHQIERLTVPNAPTRSWCRIPAAIAIARTASTTRVSSGWNAK